MLKKIIKEEDKLLASLFQKVFHKKSNYDQRKGMLGNFKEMSYNQKKSPMKINFS